VTKILEVIATCEDILHDMRECALNLEDALLNLDGKYSNDLIDEVSFFFFFVILHFVLYILFTHRSTASLPWKN
jgi:hypothetical protein